MNRCNFGFPLLHGRCQRSVLAALALAAALTAAPATAQVVDATSQMHAVRNFPPGTLQGKLVVQAPPQVLLDGKPDRLSPGSRIRSERNMLVMSGAIVGQELAVNYTRDAAGLIHEVWVLSPAELTLKRPGATPPASNIRTESDAVRAPSDDGKTPFHLLPRYGQ